MKLSKKQQKELRHNLAMASHCLQNLASAKRTNEEIKVGLSAKSVVFNFIEAAQKIINKDT